VGSKMLCLAGHTKSTSFIILIILARYIYKFKQVVPSILLSEMSAYFSDEANLIAWVEDTN